MVAFVLTGLVATLATVRMASQVRLLLSGGIIKVLHGASRKHFLLRWVSFDKPRSNSTKYLQ